MCTSCQVIVVVVAGSQHSVIFKRGIDQSATCTLTSHMKASVTSLCMSYCQPCLWPLAAYAIRKCLRRYCCWHRPCTVFLATSLMTVISCDILNWSVSPLMNIKSSAHVAFVGNICCWHIYGNSMVNKNCSLLFLD